MQFGNTYMKWGALIAFISFLVDQATKILSKSYIDTVLLDSFVHVSISGAYNRVFAFSIPAPSWLVYLVIIPVFLAVLYWWHTSARQQQVTSLWIALILGGGTGNLFDRIVHGGVYDWIELSLTSFHWSSFNVADILIVVGALGWFVHSSIVKE